MDTIKLDGKKRAVIPPGKPGQVFSWVPNADGSILLTPLKPAEPEAKEVRPIKGPNGLYRWPVKLTRQEIASYIRAERDSR